MITSNLSEPQKEFNRKMEEIKKIISDVVEDAYFTNIDVDAIKEHATARIRNILKDSFIPKPQEVFGLSEVKDDFEYLPVRVKELEKRLTETENRSLLLVILFTLHLLLL